MSARKLAKNIFIGVCGCFLASCGGGGGSPDGAMSATGSSMDPFGTWRGDLEISTELSEPGCPFDLYGKKFSRQIELSPDTAGTYYPEGTPAEFFLTGLDELPGIPFHGYARYEYPDDTHVSIDVEFDILDRDLPSDRIANTPCTKLTETVFTWIGELHPDTNSMYVSRNYNQICSLSGGRSVSCSYAYNGAFQRKK